MIGARAALPVLGRESGGRYLNLLREVSNYGAGNFLGVSREARFILEKLQEHRKP